MKSKFRAVQILVFLSVNLASALAIAANPATGAWGVDLADQDSNIKPGDDFAMFQNGHWFAHTELGPAAPNAAYWRDVRIKAATDLAQLLAKLSGDSKLAVFYRSAMDTATIESRGFAPLAVELDAIRATRDHRSMARLQGRMAGPGTVRATTARVTPSSSVFTLDVAQDRADPTRNVIYIGQGGLLLPGPEYYVDEKLVDIKQAYEKHVARVLTLIDWPRPEQNAQAIVEFETRIAQASWTQERIRDSKATHNAITFARLQMLAPAFSWEEFLRGAELPARADLVIDAPPAFARIAAIYARTPLPTIKARQAFAAAHINAQRLNAALGSAHAEFSEKVQQGLRASPDRSFAAEKWIETCLPDALGRIYVERYASPEAKAMAVGMAEGMRTALDARLASNTWLSDTSRKAAGEKLAKMSVKVGYPDHFDDYAGLDVREDDFYGNVSRAATYAWHSKVSSLGRPVDRTEWILAPFYPQYGYVATTNSVEIPAALLVPPFFDTGADSAVNYGAVGTVIGANMMAAFDTDGVSYDADGRLQPWLRPEEYARLQNATRKIAERYSKQEPLPGLHIKGVLVANEAFDDIEGIQLALDAYLASIKNNRPATLDGYTPEQRFFLGRAQMWRAKFSIDFTRNQIATGSNAPPYLRINGPLPHIDAWYSAFRVAAQDKLYLAEEERARVW